MNLQLVMTQLNDSNLYTSLFALSTSQWKSSKILSEWENMEEGNHELVNVISIYYIIGFHKY